MREIKYKCFVKKALGVNVELEGKVLNVESIVFLEDKLFGAYVFKYDSYDKLQDRIYLELGSDEFELLEFTGLKDKNGVEIFEGDIVKQELFFAKFDEKDECFIGKVIFSNGCYIVDNGKDCVVLFDELNPNEVIGNVFQNKNLLEVE